MQKIQKCLDVPEITKSITLQCPFAWLVVSSLIQKNLPTKPIENRNWPHPVNIRGYVGIHASSSWRSVLDANVMDDIAEMHPEIAKRLDHPGILEGRPDSFNLPFHTGCVVGAIEIFDCVSFDPETQDFEQLCRERGHGEWYDSFELPPAEWASGSQCLLLRNPIQFTSPIPAKGALSFWNVDKQPGLSAAIAKAMRQPHGDPVAYRAALHAAGKPAPMPNESSFAKPRKTKATA